MKIKQFFVLIFSFCLLVILAPIVSAQTVSIQPSGIPSPTVDVSPTPVDYQLPYPGLLPDNPLYKLKVLRDKIVEFLISDPLKKAEFDLLESDKRLNGSLYLFQANPKKADLVVETISKGENYVSEGISQLDLAKKQGLETMDMKKKFYVSNLKHLELIRDLTAKINPSFRKNLEREEQRIQDFIKIVNPDNLSK